MVIEKVATTKKWSRKDLKNKARKGIKRNYWKILGAVVIVAFVLAGFKFDILNSADTQWGKNQYRVSDIDILHDALIDTADKSDIVKHVPTAGILASIYNNAMGAKAFIVGGINAVNKILFDMDVSVGFTMLILAFIMLISWIFIGVPLQIGKCKYFMELSKGRDKGVSRIAFLYREKRPWNAMLIIIAKYIFWIMWCVSIVGGIYKYYSYKLIPYILAENPNIEFTRAFYMSEKMMYGNKWEAFKLDLSFLGWTILNICTLGILEWIVINPYKEMTYISLYEELRKDIEDEEMSLDSSRKLADEDEFLKDYKVPISERLSNKFYFEYDCKKKYSLTSLILMFFIFSFSGWIWEVIMHIYQDGQFVNRGFMHGPWLPIYGIGGLLMIILLKRFADTPGRIFILAMVIAGILEYITATVLLEMTGEKWWDYTGYFLNINAIVCAEGIIFFGIGALAFIYILAPICDNMLQKVPSIIRVFACIVLIISFIYDIGYTIKEPNKGDGITTYEIVKIDKVCDNERQVI